MRRTLLILIPLALAVAAFGASRGSDNAGLPRDPGTDAKISVPLSLYVVRESGGADDSNLSSRRLESDLSEIAAKVNTIWAPAAIVFDPVNVRTVELPRDVVADLMAGDSRSFTSGAGPGFTVPDPGSINGFYIPFAGGANGFTPRNSRVFFVADESSVHDERVTSHEIGHILGLGHERDDPGRLMFGGTNGMALTEPERSVARSAAVRLPGVRPPAESAAAATADRLITVSNSAGPMEGHTPRGFAGMGAGLFVGDNLNPNFPDGDGVQLFLTFDLPADLGPFTSVRLTSDALQVSGTPFDDLGPLLVESVEYDDFGPELFDIAADGPAVECERVGAGGLECDVTTALGGDLSSGSGQAQFRMRFESAGDGDGLQDLAMFFRTEPDTNDPGTFILEFSG